MHREGSVKTAFSEDVEKRFEMQGWQVLTVEDANDLQEISNALKLAREEGEKPSIIIWQELFNFLIKEIVIQYINALSPGFITMGLEM